jgi:microcystin-dependent protein
MRPDEVEPEPVSSFQTPIAPPASDPDAGDLIQVCFAKSWLPFVLGCLEQLLQQSTWKTDDPDVLSLAQSRADALIYLFVEGCSGMLAGVIVDFGGATPPDGWLLCDGSAVSRETYANLFAVIGETFGPGNGSSTFNLPDKRSRLAVGAGQGSGLSNYALAATGGEESHTLTTGEMPTHSHSASGHVHTIHSHLPGVAVTPGELPVSVPGIVPDLTSNSADSIGDAGGGNAHENRAPYLALNAIIKY